MFAKLETFVKGIFNAVKNLVTNTVGVGASFVQHVSTVTYNAILGTLNHVVAVFQHFHGFVMSVMSHISLLISPTPKPTVTAAAPTAAVPPAAAPTAAVPPAA